MKLSPTVTEAKAPGGGEDSPWSFNPQQATAPLVRRPQVWSQPVPTDAKVPSGGDALPYQSDPQHSTAPLVGTPQA